ICLVIGRLRIGPGGDDLITEWTFECGIEAAIRAIETLLPWNLDVIAQAEIQGQARIDLPIVLQIEPVEGASTIGLVVVVNAPAGGGAEQERGYPVSIKSALPASRELLRPAFTKSELGKPGVVTAPGLVVELEAGMKCVPASIQSQTWSEVPLAEWRP